MAKAIGVVLGLLALVYWAAGTGEPRSVRPRLLLIGDSIAHRVTQEGVGSLAVLSETYQVEVVSAPYLYMLPLALEAMPDPNFAVVVVCIGYHDKQFGTHDVTIRKCIDAFQDTIRAPRFVWVDTRNTDELPRSRVDEIHLSAEGYREFFQRLEPVIY